MKNYTMDLPVSEKYSSYNNIIHVDKQSDVDLHEKVYELARYFKNELNNDSVPFCQRGRLSEVYKALLFTEQALDKYEKEPMPYRIYGACLFTVKQFTKDNDSWVLKWIWFHPFFRNRGNLKNNWNKLEEEFGNFLIEKPLSNDMNSFLKNIDSKYEHRVI